FSPYRFNTVRPASEFSLVRWLPHEPGATKVATSRTRFEKPNDLRFQCLYRTKEVFHEACTLLSASRGSFRHETNLTGRTQNGPSFAPAASRFLGHWPDQLCTASAAICSRRRKVAGGPTRRSLRPRRSTGAGLCRSHP